MFETIYPQEEQRIFTDREHLLSILNLSREMLTQGVRKHLALSGLVCWQNFGNDNCLQKVHRLDGRSWCISQSGFTSEAEGYARENGILFSNRLQIEALAKAIRE